MTAQLEHELDLGARLWGLAWNPTGTQLAACGGGKAVHIIARSGDRWIQREALEGAHARTVRAGTLLATR